MFVKSKSTPSPPEVLPNDEGLRCPSCGYNLTGLADERCPECGRAFDREELTQARDSIPAPVPGWDDSSGSALQSFARTCLATWLRPAQFGRQFPACHFRRPALLFRLGSLGAALAVNSVIALVMGCVGRTSGRNLALFGLVAPIGAITGVIACELALTLLFTLTLRRKSSRPRAAYPAGSVSWRGLIGFFRSFVMLSAASVGLFFALASFSPRWYVPTRMALFLVVIWWCMNLSRAVTAAAPPGRGRLLACLAIPAIAIGAIYLGYLTSFMSGVILVVIIQPANGW